MAVYYKFKSEKDYNSIPLDGPFISVGTLKERILKKHLGRDTDVDHKRIFKKHLGRGTDVELVITHAQSDEEYLDEATLIPKYTSVLIRRVPGLRCLPIFIEQEQKVENVVKTEPGKSTSPAVDISVMKYPEDLDWDDFGDDLYATPNLLPVQSSNLNKEAPSTNKDDETSKIKVLIATSEAASTITDEDSKIKAIIDTPALDWQSQGSDGFGPGRGFGKGVGGRMVTGQGFGLQQKTPPQGYVCHRCKVPGHFIQHCSTNGDPNYDIRRVKPPTGIPRSMLMENPDGSYALPNGVVAVVKPNEVAFEKEMEGLPSTHSSHSSSDLQPELLCPLCNVAMKDAALTKCCFKSFCDKCIRGYIISKSNCVCGAKDILADDILPNKTLRDTISRMVEGVNASSQNAGSTFQVPDTDAVSCPQPKTPSSTSSAASKGEQKVSPANEEDDSKVVSAPQQKSEILMATRASDLSEVTTDSMSVNERALEGSAQQVEEVPQKLAPSEAGKKQKKKNVHFPIYDNQWKTLQDPGIENYMMPMCPPAYNSYWNSMQPGMEGFIPPYGAMQRMDYGLSPFNMTFEGVLPQYSSYMLPVVPPQRNFSKGREFSREVSSGRDVYSMKSKHKSNPPSSSREYHGERWQRLESSSKMSSTITEDRKLKKGIKLPDQQVTKKRKLPDRPSSTDAANNA